MVTRGCVGRRVEVEEYGPGTLSYFGSTSIGKGQWCGVTLESPIGNHNGSLHGRKYFKCTEKRGVLVPVGQVRLISEDKVFPPKVPDAAASNSLKVVETTNKADGEAKASNTDNDLSELIPKAPGTPGRKTWSSSKIDGSALIDLSRRRPSISKTQTSSVDQSPTSKTTTVKDKMPSTSGDESLNTSISTGLTISSTIKGKRPSTGVTGLEKKPIASTDLNLSSKPSSIKKKRPSTGVQGLPNSTGANAGPRTGKLPANPNRSQLSQQETKAQVKQLQKASVPTATADASGSHGARSRSSSSGKVLPSPNGSPHLGDRSVANPSPKAKRRVLPVVGAPVAAAVSENTTNNREGAQFDSSAVQGDQRLQIYREKILMLQSDLANARADATKKMMAVEEDGFEKVTKLTTVNSNLETENAALRTTLEALKRDVASATFTQTQEQESLSAKLVWLEKVRQDQEDALNAEIASLQDRLLRVEQDLVDASKRDIRSREGLKEKSLEVENLKQQVSEQLAAAKTKEQSTKALTLQQQKHLDAVKGQLAASDRLCEALKAKKRDIEKKGADLARTTEAKFSSQLKKKEEECVKLKNEVETLIQTAKNMEQSHDAEVQLLKRKEESVTTALSTANEIASTAKQAQLEELKTERDKLAEELQGASTNLEMANNRAVIEKQKMIVLSTEHDQDLKALNDVLEKTKGHVTDVEIENSKLASDNKTLRERLNHEIEVHKENKLEFERQLAALVSSGEASQVEHLRTVESLERNAQTDNSRQAEEITLLQKKIQELKSEIVTLSRKDSELELSEAHVNSVKRELERCKIELSEKLEEVEKSATKISSLEARIRESNKSLQEEREKFKASKEELTRSKSRFKSTQIECSELRDQLAQTQLRVVSSPSNNNTGESGMDGKDLSEKVREELLSLQHVVEIKRGECKELRVEVLALEEKLELQRTSSSKMLSEITRLKTQNEELNGTLESKRAAHEQAVVDNAHLKEDMASLAEDMRLLANNNNELKNQLQNYRRDLESSGIVDPFNRISSPGSSPTRTRAIQSSTPVRRGTTFG